MLVPNHAIKSKHRHSMYWDGTGMRLMVVRNPYDRWAAIYWRHHQRRDKKGIYLSDFAGDINEYVYEWNRDRKHSSNPTTPWCFNQSEMADMFKPHKTFHLEDGLDKVLKYLNVPYIHLLHHNSNTSPDKKSWQETMDLLTPTNLKIVQEFCKPDIKRFGY